MTSVMDNAGSAVSEITLVFVHTEILFDGKKQIVNSFFPVLGPFLTPSFFLPRATSSAFAQI